MAAGLGALAANAAGDAEAPSAVLLALFEKKGLKIFDGDKAFGLLGEVDAYYFDTCPGTKLDVTATDFSYSGMPTVVAAGPAALKLTNGAPSEAHEMAMAKLTPAGEMKDPVDLLPLPDKKIAKFIDFDTTGFVFAEAGDEGYGIVDLEPGTYLYGCFITEGGKKNGTPHWQHGMWGTFEVQ